MSWVRNIENCTSFAESLSGQREFVTMMSRSIAVPESRSVSTRPLNHMTPKTGVDLPFGIRDSAARASRRLSVNFSGCGW